MPLSIVPDQVDIAVVYGTDNYLVVQLTVDDLAQDITLDTVVFTVRSTKYATTPLVTLTNAPGGHSTPTTGETTFLVTSEHTQILVPTRGRYKTFPYDIRRINSSGEEMVHIEGTFSVHPSASSPA